MFAFFAGSFMLVCCIDTLKNTQNFPVVGVFSLFSFSNEYMDLYMFSEVPVPSIVNYINNNPRGKDNIKQDLIMK